MTSDRNDGEAMMEQMPEALLAEMFSRGVVVISEEMEERKTTQMPAPVTVGRTVTETPPAENATIPGRKYASLGAFGKKVLVVVNDPTSLHLNQEDLDFLSKILAAVNLSMADIALVNAATQQPEYFALQEQYPAGVAVYFGIQPVDIGAPIKFPQFQIQKWNHCTFLYAPAFEEMGPLAKNAVALKRELWSALQKIFAS